MNRAARTVILSRDTGTHIKKGNSETYTASALKYLKVTYPQHDQI